MNLRGFTLVELAIVITIIGLLIGGVLKGQELLQNARMTSAAALYKGLDTAALTFKDVYKALPGDITAPASFIQNCTSAPCNVGGDGNGLIGPVNSSNQENGNFWGHMSRAGLLSGVNTDKPWTAVDAYEASSPVFPLGGQLFIHNMSIATGALQADGLAGHYYIPYIHLIGPAVPNNVSMKLDLKVDDGRPWRGELKFSSFLDTACAPTAQVYDPADSRNCYPYMRTAF